MILMDESFTANTMNEADYRHKNRVLSLTFSSRHEVAKLREPLEIQYNKRIMYEYKEQ